jgi:hypothetical protein
MKRINKIVTPAEARICFVFKAGSASSFFPAINPFIMEAIHIIRKVNANKTGNILSLDEGQGLSPKIKSQKKPAAAPKMTREIIAEIKKPGIPNKSEYRYLLFILKLKRYDHNNTIIEVCAKTALI